MSVQACALAALWHEVQGISLSVACLFIAQAEEIIHLHMDVSAAGAIWGGLALYACVYI